jgi:hypothetical protein
MRETFLIVSTLPKALSVELGVGVRVRVRVRG